MARLPRVAVGTLTPQADATALVWGLAAALEACGQHVQMFCARACFAALDGATVISGRAARHLDSWLMTPETARQALLRGTTEGHLALVEGTFPPVGQSTETGPALGGQLDVLCDWLELPWLAVVDVTQLHGCRLPPRPAAEGLLLDRVSSEAGFYRSQTLLESFWGIPVLGGMEEAESLRQAIGCWPLVSGRRAGWVKPLGKGLPA